MEVPLLFVSDKMINDQLVNSYKTLWICNPHNVVGTEGERRRGSEDGERKRKACSLVLTFC